MAWATGFERAQENENLHYNTIRTIENNNKNYHLDF